MKTLIAALVLLALAGCPAETSCPEEDTGTDTATDTDTEEDTDIPDHCRDEARQSKGPGSRPRL